MSDVANAVVSLPVLRDKKANDTLVVCIYLHGRYVGFWQNAYSLEPMSVFNTPRDVMKYVIRKYLHNDAIEVTREYEHIKEEVIREIEEEQRKREEEQRKREEEYQKRKEFENKMEYCLKLFRRKKILLLGKETFAYVYGPWAIHKIKGYAKNYRLTHIPSQRRAYDSDVRELLAFIACELNRVSTIDWNSPEPKINKKDVEHIFNFLKEMRVDHW